MNSDASKKSFDAPLAVNGWSIYAHGSFLDQYELLVAEVEKQMRRNPNDWKKKNSAKRLAAVLYLITLKIPSSPNSSQFKQGFSLGKSRKNWFRAKFLKQYRMFFQFDSTRKIIVLGWFNDEKTLRARGSRTDAYKTFSEMLDRGNPPENFEVLLSDARNSAKRFKKTLKSTPEQGGN